jgi:outer membrane lipoprotein-sorting protein
MDNLLKFLKTIIFCIIAVFFPICGQDLKSPSADNSALPLIDSIVSSQASIRSISCNYHQKRWINNVGPSEYQGMISYKAPEKILMHFLYPADEYVLVDDSMVLIYGVKNEYGIRYNKKCLSPAEKQIADQIGQIRMNLLATMRSTYFFSYSGKTDAENTIIAATPKSGWKSLGKITIAIDMKKRIMKSIELFSKDGPLVSSSVYSDFIQAPATTAFFPRSMTTVVNAGEGVQQKDEIFFSRVIFNKDFPENHFSITLSKNAKIIDNVNKCNYNTPDK